MKVEQLILVAISLHWHVLQHTLLECTQRPLHAHFLAFSQSAVTDVHTCLTASCSFLWCSAPEWNAFGSSQSPGMLLKTRNQLPSQVAMFVSPAADLLMTSQSGLIVPPCMLCPHHVCSLCQHLSKSQPFHLIVEGAAEGLHCTVSPIVYESVHAS